jgi:hypothetical protein
MKLKTLLLLSFISLNSYSQELDDIWKDKNKKNVDKTKILNYEEVVLDEESLFGGDPTESGFPTDSHYSGNDAFRFTVNILGNPSYQDFTDLTSVEVHMAMKLDQTWLEGFIGFTDTNFERIASNRENVNVVNPNSESNFIRNDNTEEKMRILGLGTGYRFKFFSEILAWNNVYETISAFATYTSLDESGRNLTYSGPGLKADYGLNRRFNQSFFAGFKLSYNLSLVTRDALSEIENKKDRTLTLSWMSVGVGMGFYF